MEVEFHERQVNLTRIPKKNNALALQRERQHFKQLMSWYGTLYSV